LKSSSSAAGSAPPPLPPRLAPGVLRAPPGNLLRPLQTQTPTPKSKPAAVPTPAPAPAQSPHRNPPAKPKRAKAPRCVLCRARADDDHGGVVVEGQPYCGQCATVLQSSVNEH
jgi:hypothetical protein